jgi:hypothetical protein
MHVVTNKIRRGEKEYTATLLRRSYREDGKVKKETLANLSHLPAGVTTRTPACPSSRSKHSP